MRRVPAPRPTAASGQQVTVLLDLDAFCRWLAGELGAAAVEAGASLRGDLGVDELRAVQLAAGLERLMGQDGAVEMDVYQHLRTVRDLHLYYLGQMSSPLDEAPC